MKINQEKKYYLTHANDFGWGPKKTNLNKERTAILDKFVVGKKVLDIGCGTGIYVDYLTKKGFEATGIDYVKEFIDFAEICHKGKFFVGSAAHLAFKDKTFNTVMTFDVLEHVENDRKVLKEIKRVAKKRIIIFVPRQTDKDLESLGLIFRHYIDTSHLRYYTVKDLKELCRELKIKIIKLEEIRPISIKSLFISQFNGLFILKKFLQKVIFLLLKPKKFYLDICLVGDVT